MIVLQFAFFVGCTEPLFRLMRAIVLRSDLHPTEAEEAFAGARGRARVRFKIARKEARRRDAYFPLSVSLMPPMAF